MRDDDLGGNFEKNHPSLRFCLADYHITLLLCDEDACAVLLLFNLNGRAITYIGMCLCSFKYMLYMQTHTTMHEHGWK